MAEQCKYHFGPGAAYATIKGCPFCWQDRAIVAEAMAADADVLRVENDRLREALTDISTGESHILAACDGCGGTCHVERADVALATGPGPGEGE